MVCFLRLLSRTITPNRTRTQRQVLRFLYALLHSLRDAHNGATNIKSDLKARRNSQSALEGRGSQLGAQCLLLALGGLFEPASCTSAIGG